MLKKYLLSTVLLLLLTSCGPSSSSEKQDAGAPSTTSVAVSASEVTNDHKSVIEDEQNAKDVKNETIKDQNDREVEVSYPVKRIACMQHHSFDILTQLGKSDLIVATEDKLEKDLGEYIKDYVDTEKIPRCGTLAEPDVEAIAATKPDLVLLAAQANPDAIAKLEKLGIATLVITLRGEGKQEEAQNPRLSDADKAYTDGLEWVVKTLGKLTDSEKRADELWDFCIQSRKMVEDTIKDIDDKDLKRVFVANENDQTYGNDKYVGCQLLRAGAKNVASEEITGYKPYSVEQLYKWNPEIIIVQDRYPEVLEMIKTDAKYKDLDAVKNDQIIEAPYWTKPFGNPDTDSIALGELYLAHKFYPEKISKETVEKRAQEFYEKFYGKEFTGKVD